MLICGDSGLKWITKKLASLTYLCFFIALSGCIPTIENTYKTPQVKGKLIHFTPNDTVKFTPVSNAKIYYKAYPESVIYSDSEGEFLLAAIMKTEAKFIMVGHALINSPIVIEYGLDSYITFARATLNSRYLEKINQFSIILPSIENKDFEISNVDHKLSWPCDLKMIKSLDQALLTTQQLVDANIDMAMLSYTEQVYVTEHYRHSIELLSEAEGSCQWQQYSSVEQFEYIAQTRDYFSRAGQLLNDVDFDANVDIGRTLEFLLASEGDPHYIIHSLPEGEHFDSYYYLESNTTYIVNTETGYICAVAKGRHTATCQSENMESDF